MKHNKKLRNKKKDGIFSVNMKLLIIFIINEVKSLKKDEKIVYNKKLNKKNLKKWKMTEKFKNKKKL